jgi:hypothetical protein
MDEGTMRRARVEWNELKSRDPDVGLYVADLLNVSRFTLHRTLAG